MKPIKCWDCLYLGKCMDYNKHGCEKFVKWKLTYKEIADICKVHQRTVFRWFSINEREALATIYRLSGLKLKVVYDGYISFLVRVVDKEKENER